MDGITADQVLTAIQVFLGEQLEKKREPEQKALDKCKPEDNEKKVVIQERIKALEHKYTRDIWMKDAATRMAGQLKFGTHISKGVHPDSKGDNVNFSGAGPLPKGIVGSQTLASLSLDANGNAAALPLAAFFDAWVNEEDNIKIVDVIQEGNSVLSTAFATDTDQSKKYVARFKDALGNPDDKPATHGRNKQILWPLDGAIEDDQYISLVPLYPSSLTNDFLRRVNAVRYSQENKQARDNRKKKSVEQQAYKAVPDVAVVRLGGTKPQNISRLISKQSGRNYLLQSLPPKIGGERVYRLTKEQASFFSSRLNQYTYFGLKNLFAVVSSEKKTVEQRDANKQGLDIILAEVLKAAANIQGVYPEGWSQDYSLSMAEKYWLDPKRGDMAGEDEFLSAQEASDWHQEIIESFALWLNGALRAEFPKRSAEFGDAEYREWKRAMESAIGVSKRAKEGIFA
ncbi:MAG: type I-F CRISPR-associated protein Csy1 [Cycloclasticus sp.]|jgi:CRISPR-associated protein, Csy1 family